MSRFQRFGSAPRRKLVRETSKGIKFVDYKEVEELRRCMSPNGKIYGRKRLSVNAQEQRMIAQAIKRARHLGLLPFTSATL
jgi:small subunit ribosomal protein S18